MESARVVEAARRRLLVVLVLLVVALTALVGCGPLPGVGDVALDYECAPGGSAPAPTTLKRAIAARLGAARVAADVTVDGSRVRLVVDRGSEDAVRDLLRWRGGVTLAAEAPLPAAPDARTVIEPLGPERARTRAVREPPLATLDADALTRVAVGSDGRSLDFDVHPARARAVDDLLAAMPGKVLVVRDDSLLGVAAPKAGGGFSVTVGEGVYAYTRAERVRMLLVTPELPALAPRDRTPLPADYATLVLGLVLPVALSLAWLSFVRRFDRLHPEPLWLVSVVFGLGVLSVIPAALLEIAWARASIALNPSYATMGGRAAALPYALFVFTLVVGVSEEGSKLLAALFVRRRREFDEPIDGIVYGVAAALGFAAAENVKYFATGRLAPSLVLARTFTSIPAHLFFATLWGYALGQTLVPGRPRGIVLRAFAIAAVLHGAFDALASTRGLTPVALLLNLGLASSFVVLVRRALRRGAVDRDLAPLSAERSTVVRVGSPLVFWLGAIGVHAAALSAVVLGAVYEGSGARPGPWFFVTGAFAFAVLVVSAWAISATIPLDVVVDAHGVTFAGSLRRWERIGTIARARSGPMRYLRVGSPDGDLWIGPVNDRHLISLEALLARGAAS